MNLLNSSSEVSMMDSSSEDSAVVVTHHIKKNKLRPTKVVFCEWCQLQKNADLIEEGGITKYCNRCGQLMYLCLKHSHIQTTHLKKHL